jgi:hypothetical protein
VIHLDAGAVPTSDTAGVRSAERGPVGMVGAAAPVRPYARLASGPGLPDRVLKRLLCAGRVRTVVRDGGNVLDLGRSHRLVSDKLFRALLIRDHGQCAHPGCGNTRSLQAHHVVHWLDSGRTDLANLVLLCEPHHQSHHHDEFAIKASTQGFVLTRNDGRAMPTYPNPEGYITTQVQVEGEHPDVAAAAATPNWDGQRLDRDYAVSVLAQRRKYAA